MVHKKERISMKKHWTLRVGKASWKTCMCQWGLAPGNRAWMPARLSKASVRKPQAAPSGLLISLRQHWTLDQDK
jgi:hypothetical protein